MRMPATPIAFAAFCLGMMVVSAAAADRDIRPASTDQVALQPATAAADVAEVVAPNCLLPGQIRNFGGVAIVTPRRSVTLAAADCAARGGEPIAGTAAAN